MKSKIIKSYSNEDTGTSSVTIQNKYGKFFGWAFCSPEDMENFSHFAGERYAEYRAYGEFCKFRLKQEKIKLKTIQNLIKDIEHDVVYDHSICNPFMRKINLKLRDYTQSVSDWENLCDFYSQIVYKQDEIRQDIINRDKKK